MALAYQCPLCGSEIVVVYLEPGEEAVCGSCGGYSPVPATARTVDDPPSIEPRRAPRAAPAPRDESVVGGGLYRRMSFEAVWARAFAIFGRHFLKLTGIAFIFYLPLLIVTIMSAGSLNAESTEAEFHTAAVILPLLGALSLVVLQPVATAAILHAVFQALLGRSLNVGGSLRTAMTRIFPIWGVSIVVTFLTALGLVLFFIGSAIVAVVYYVAVPVTVVERAGIGTSLSRSATLTKGRRWVIFGLNFLTGVLFAIPSFIMGFLFVASPVAGPLARFALQLVSGVFMAVMMGVIYHDLRVEKEGLDTEHIASVFD